MIKVRVPATSANFGPGFDSIGLALSLYNTVEMEEWDSVLIESDDEIKITSENENLVVQTMKDFYKVAGKKFTGIHIIQKSDIPMTRGLGSSSACVIAGLYGANALLGSPMTELELIDHAVEIEGHPDNVVPAAVGGFTVSTVDEGKTHFIKTEIGDEINFAVFVPDFEMKTSFARKILPSSVSLEDTIFNLSHAALAASAFIKKDYSLLKYAVSDKLHEPYRLPLIHGADDIISMAKDLGAYATYLSGAGSSIISVVSSNDTRFEQKASAFLKNSESLFNVAMLRPDNQGAAIL
ncbi:MAG: homoserine kinase [Bacillota bacterium]|nr:homoserine kinase [Bacillota bacterium]